jgi:hypothetical protein
MARQWFSLALVLALGWSAASFAAKPIKNAAPAASAPVVNWIKIDYNTGQVIVQGENLDPSTAAVSLGGVSLALDGASTTETLLLPVTETLASEVTSMGNYVFQLSNDGGSVSLSAFIPIALDVPVPPPPPGPDCPCSTEWDIAGSAASPDGFAGQTPYCEQDTGSFVTVQYYDVPANNYWVLWTEWTGSSGYCELYIDGPNRELTTEAQFDACAGYLRNIVTIYGSQEMSCLF